MESTIKHIIANILSEYNTITSSDVLIDLNHINVFLIEDQQLKISFNKIITPSLQKLIQLNESVYRESGIHPISLSHGIMEWNYKNKIVQTPLFLIPLTYQKNKINGEVNFQLIENESFINPFIINYFKNTYNIEIPLFEFNEHFCMNFKDWIKAISFNAEIKQESYIGNFHHHRFQIIKDLEGIKDLGNINSNILQILGKEDVENNHTFSFVNDNLFPADNDQLSVFKEINFGNTVVQGPPGTGKSQVLSNVLGKILYSNSNALVVSEKRVALEVLQKKLALFELDEFSFVTTSETVSNDFISSLKKVWDKMENMSSKVTVNLHLSEQYLQNLQLQLNLLTQKKLIGGVSYDEFVALSKETDFSKAHFSSEVPTIVEFLQDVKAIETIYKSNLNEIISFIPFQVVKSESFETFDSKILIWKKDFDKLAFHFHIDTLSDLHKSMKIAAICQVIENEARKPYISILNPDSKERKKYSLLKKKFLSIQNQVLEFENEKRNWKIEPSENEAINLLEALKSTSYFVKRKAKRRISQLANSSFVDPVNALSNWIIFLEKQKIKSKLQFEFKEIGVDTPDTEISIIDSFIFQLHKKDWAIYSELSSEKRQNLCELHSTLYQCNSILKTYFQLSNEQSISAVFSNLSNHYEELIRLRPYLLSLNRSSYRLIGKMNFLDEFIKSVYKSNWVKFESHFPEFSKFNSKQLSSKITSIIAAQDEENKLFSKQIIEKIHSIFKEYHYLLRTPAHKLKDDQKKQKQILRKGKAILVKEFAKSRSHPSIRELLQTEAAIWINLLKPIWLSNPTQVAKCFPLTEGLFDVVIFDEASQIPLSNALGSLQRGKRIIVAGDEQQMSPTSYFKSVNSESIDLLHQAGYYWKNTFLKHHYRSAHPLLIAFSNQHFYDNSLIAYPSADSIENPLRLHHCVNGKFEDRVNTEEAIMVAKLIEEYLETKKSLGVVAFSEIQLSCIWEKLSVKSRQLLSERIESGDVFFKALENVQGEECDHLIISLGYAKNSKDEFKMLFGPLNQKSGSKRLNVLLTRAIKTIDFVTSVTSSDFKISKNESINLLRLFLNQMEEKSINSMRNNEVDYNSIIFPYNLTPAIVKKEHHFETHFKSIYSTLSNANEIVTFQRVLENRKWKVLYD